MPLDILIRGRLLAILKSFKNPTGVSQCKRWWSSDCPPEVQRKLQKYLGKLGTRKPSTMQMDISGNGEVGRTRKNYPESKTALENLSILSFSFEMYKKINDRRSHAEAWNIDQIITTQMNTEFLIDASRSIT